MIDTMFWPFAFKAAAERHNQLSLTASGQMPLSILHNVPIENIPVKTFHTLFCPVYMLDSQAQSAGGPGPPKWEPCSCIGVYLGHSPFHAGSVALIFNPRTGWVSPQYHVIFNDTFSTIPYMDAGTVPPHWEDLLKHSSEKATDEEFSLAEDWMDLIKKMPGDQSNVTAGSRITDPFAVVTKDSNISPANAAQAAHASQDQPPKARGMQASKGGDKRTLLSLGLLSNAAASLALKRRRLPPTDDAAAQTGSEFGSPVDTDALARNQLTMPQRVNLHEAGLHRSPCLKELEANKSNDKAHVTWESKATRAITLFTLYSLVTDVKIDMPAYNISSSANFAEQAACRLHEVNELYDGTLNSICAYAFSNIALDMSNNEVFAYTKAMQQPDAPQFIKAMVREIEENKSRKHWEIVRHSTIPPGKKTIQAI